MGSMDKRLVGLLFGIGLKVALAVALNNIAIGFGVGVVFTAGLVTAAQRNEDK